MPLDLMDIPTGNGGWFKPREVADAVAILVEVHQWDRQRPTPNGPKDSALCDVSVFKTPEHLDRLAPEVSKGMRIEQTVLARDLEKAVGKGILATVAHVPSSKPGGNPFWVWKQINDPAMRKQVMTYVAERDAAVEAAVADAPDFD